MNEAALVAIAVMLFAWAVTSARLGRLGVTAPLAFVAVGFVLARTGVIEVTATSSVVRHVAEAALVLLVFSDASRVDTGSVRTEGGMWLRLLGLGVPLALIAGTGLALLCFPNFGIWSAVLVAACLTPTDAGLAADVISNPAMPPRVARALNVESGVNDGLVAPIVALAIAGAAEAQANTSGFVLTAAEELSKGAVAGLVVGAICATVVVFALRRGWLAAEADSIAVLAVGGLSYLSALAIDGNGFVAAFLAGLVFGRARRSLEPAAFEFTEQAGQILAMFVWFVLGAAVLRPALEGANWRIVLYAVLVLTVARMVPVALSLLGTHMDWATVLFMGWFGPRGLASLVFGLLTLDELGAAGASILVAIAITVLASVVLHGLTAGPLVARYRRRLDDLDDDHPTLIHAPAPTGRRPLGTAKRPTSDGLGRGGTKVP